MAKKSSIEKNKHRRELVKRFAGKRERLLATANDESKSMEERFEVLEGNPSFLSGRAWSTAAPGETVVVSAGARHAYRNRSGQTAHMVCHAKPPSTLQEFLEETAEPAAPGRSRAEASPPASAGCGTGCGSPRDASTSPTSSRDPSSPSWRSWPTRSTRFRWRAPT